MTSPMTELVELRQALQEREREIAKLKGQLETANGTLTKTTKELKSAKLHLAIGAAARKAGVIPGAIVDVANRAERSGDWDFDKTGQLRRKDENGFFDESVTDWLRKVRNDVPFYFEDSALTEDLRSPEGERNGTGGGGAGLETDPELLRMFDPKTMNLTKASKFAQEQPDRAAKIAEQVGNKIFLRVIGQAKR